MRVQVGRHLGTVAVAAALSGLLAPSAWAQDLAPVSLDHSSWLDASFLATSPLADQANSSQSNTAPPPSKPHHEGIGLGVKGGFMFASLDNSPLTGDPLSSKTGTTIGLFFGGNRPGTLGVMGEFDYNMRKANDTLQNTSLSIYSFEIPVLVRVNVGARSLSGMLGYVIVGPAVDIQLKAKQNNLDIGDNYKGVNLDVVFGGGIEITRFLIEIREDIGLRGVNNGNFGNTTSIHTKTFELLFGFRIN